jgi:hypothetical protein
MSRPQGHRWAGRHMSMKNSIGRIGNRIRHLPACSTVPQPTALPRTPMCACACARACVVYVHVCAHLCINVCMHVCMYVWYCFSLLSVTQLGDKALSHSRCFKTDLVMFPRLTFLVHNLKFISMANIILYPVHTLFSRRLLSLLRYIFIF